MRKKAMPRHAAKIYLSKAEEFLRASQEANQRNDWNAAGLGAVHAGISAVDAATTWFLGERSRDVDHESAAQLVRQLEVDDAPDRAEQFVRLVRDKNVIEYEARSYEAGEADVALKRAQRLVSWASELLGE